MCLACGGLRHKCARSVLACGEVCKDIVNVRALSSAYLERERVARGVRAMLKKD